jgi:hypothetical protein
VDAGGSKKEVPGGVGSSNRRKRTSFPPPPPKKPLQPTADNPFPEKKDFRLGIYRILEERDDYLLCTGYDPNAKNPFSEVTPSAFRSGVLLKIAKPWQGEDVVEIPYEVGDLIVAVQIKKNAAVDGMEVTDEEGTRLRWIDLNVDGRRPAQIRYAQLVSSLSAASSFLTGATMATAVFVEEDANSPGNLVATADTLTVINRWVDLELDSGKFIVVQRIQSEWVIVASECP